MTMKKLCLGIWCPATIIVTVLFFSLILSPGLYLIFTSMNWCFDAPVHDIGHVTSIDANHIDKSNERKKVYLTGNITTDDILTDPLFGFMVSNAIQLKRVVKKFEGQDKGWTTTSSPLNSETFITKNFKLGAFTLSQKLVDKIKIRLQWLPIQKALFEQIPNQLSVQLEGPLHLHNGNYYVGQDPNHPQFGDLRIQFFVNSTKTVSVIARQADGNLVSVSGWHHYHDITLLKSGIASLEEVILTHSRKFIPVEAYYFVQFGKRLPLYLLGFFILLFGLYLLFLTLKLFHNNFPPKWIQKDSQEFLLILLAMPSVMFIVAMNESAMRMSERDIIIENIMVVILIAMVASFQVLFISRQFLRIIILFYAIILFAIIPFVFIIRDFPFLNLNQKITFILISLGILLGILGIYVIALLLNKLFKKPFFDNLINRLNWLSILIITVSLTLVILAGIWMSYLPILSVILIMIAIGFLYLLKPAHRLLTVPNFELPEPKLKPETVVPQKGSSS
jgi:hypothetical protein